MQVVSEYCYICMNLSFNYSENWNIKINPEYQLGTNTICTIAFTQLNPKTNLICVCEWNDAHSVGM